MFPGKAESAHDGGLAAQHRWPRESRRREVRQHVLGEGGQGHAATAVARVPTWPGELLHAMGMGPKKGRPGVPARGLTSQEMKPLTDPVH